MLVSQNKLKFELWYSLAIPLVGIYSKEMIAGDICSPKFKAVCVCVNTALNSSHSLLPLLCPQVHSLCLVSIPALEIGSSVPFL